MLLPGAVAVVVVAASAVVVSAGSGGAAPVSQARVAAKAPPIVVRDFRFLGFDKDVVGRGADTEPNGEPDGHFRVVLATPKGGRTVWSLQIWRCASLPDRPTPTADTGDKDCLGGRPLASTPQTANAYFKTAALGVFRDGKRLTLGPGGTQLKLPRLSAKGVQLDLYVNNGLGCPLPAAATTPPNCRAAFAPGQRYLLFVMTMPPAFSTWISRPGDKVPQVASPQVALRNLRFIGFDKDVTGPEPSSPPDGKPEAHWSVDLATPAGPRWLSYVTLERVRADTDRPDQPGAWCAPGCFASPGPDPRYRHGLYLTIHGNAEPVLIGAGNKTVSPDLPYTTTGVRLDLYAVDAAPSVFTAGQRFRVTVQIGVEDRRAESEAEPDCERDAAEVEHDNTLAHPAQRLALPRSTRTTNSTRTEMLPVPRATLSRSCSTPCAQGSGCAPSRTTTTSRTRSSRR